LLFLLLALPAAVQAQFAHTTNGNTITITGYAGPGGAIIIPGTINGLPVTRIGDYAFFDRTSLTGVTIPDSVTSIGNNAFYGCTGLTHVTISDNVKSIGIAAFYRCTNLSKVVIGNSVTLLGSAAFYGCTKLSNVVIGNSVIYIGGRAFQGCVSLISVTIPNSVAAIEVGAFGGCVNLTKVTIGSSVATIGVYAFADCIRLSAIEVTAFNSVYRSVDGVLFNQSQTALVQYPLGKAGSYTIPPNVTVIGVGAFFGCTSLSSITIPDSVTHIDGYAFGNTSLTGVFFQGNAPNVELAVFDGSGQSTIYFLPGTTGWTSTFAGRPTALWNPEAQTSDDSFGVRAGRFGFTIHWASGKTVVVESCTDLGNPAWTPVGTNTLTGGSAYFSDPDWGAHPARFYRLRSP
jgi:hypothetical protein